MKVTRHGQRAAIILTLLVTAIAAWTPPGAASAHGGPASPARAGGCPAETVRNSALGVTLTLPPGWQEAEPGHYAPWAVVLDVPAAAGQGENNLRLSIEPLGTTADSNDARAAAAAATRATRGLMLPITRRPFTVAAAPGVLLRGMPGGQPHLTIIVAHKHALYQIITFGGETFAADQRAALASLRFIPRVGPYPMTTPSANASAPRPPSLALTVRESGRLGGVSVEATGQGYRPNETLVLEGCWIGAAGSGLPPLRDAWFVLAQTARATRRGTLNALVTFPVPPMRFAASTVRVTAHDGRIGQRLARAMRSFTVQASATSCPSSRPVTAIGSYMAALARRDADAARACLTPAYRRGLQPTGVGYFGPLQEIISIRPGNVQERPLYHPLPPGLAPGARLFLVSYVGRWRHPLVLENGPHAVFIWVIRDAPSGQWRIAMEGTGP